MGKFPFPRCIPALPRALGPIPSPIRLLKALINRLLFSRVAQRLMAILIHKLLFKCPNIELLGTINATHKLFVGFLPTFLLLQFPSPTIRLPVILVGTATCIRPLPIANTRPRAPVVL